MEAVVSLMLWQCLPPNKEEVWIYLPCRERNCPFIRTPPSLKIVASGDCKHSFCDLDFQVKLDFTLKNVYRSGSEKIRYCVTQLRC